MSRRNLLLCATVVWVAAAAQDRLTVKVTPGQVFPNGDAVRITCTVPRDDDNRLVSLGIEDWTQSTREVNGVVTHTLWVFHAPCEAGDAFCAVVRANGKTARTTAPFRVVGCDHGLSRR